MNLNDPKNLRGFTDRFAEFVLVQINFWFSNVYKKPAYIESLEKAYYEGMWNAANSLYQAFSKPYHQNPYFPLHEVVLNIEEVEILKGILGDNYRFLKSSLEGKRS